MLNEKLQYLIDLGNELMITNERILSSIEAVERCDINDDSYQDEEDNLHYVRFQKEQIIRLFKRNAISRDHEILPDFWGMHGGDTKLKCVKSIFEFGAFFIYSKPAVGHGPGNTHYEIIHLNSGKWLKTFCDLELAIEYTVEIGIKYIGCDTSSNDDLSNIQYNWSQNVNNWSK